MSEQLDLLPSSGTLTWLPGETVFSLCSRYHYLWGLQSARRTASKLFGSHRLGFQHDLPLGIDPLLAALPQLGEATTIIRERTLAPYFLPFYPQDRQSALIASMRDGLDSHFKAKLGLLGCRVRANNPLKACPECVALELKHFGAAYWHREHQLPGVWVCLKHKRLLLESISKSNGVRPYSWLLPAPALLRDVAAPKAEGSLPALLAFSRFVANVLTLPQLFHFDRARLGQTLKTQLELRGYVSAGGVIRLERVAGWYIEASLPIRLVPELQLSIGSLSDLARQLGRLFVPAVRYPHPLKWLVLAYTLFGRWGAFIAAYERLGAQTRPTISRVRSRHTPTSDLELVAQAKQLIKAELKRHPHYLRTQIRRAQPGAFARLMRHDRSWLTSRMPTRKVQADKALAIRDAALSDAISKAAPKLLRQHSGVEISKWMLKQELPHLAPLLDRLGTFPVARAAVYELKRRSLPDRVPPHF